MKLVLANNQSQQFVDFYDDLNQRAIDGVEYTSYVSLLFVFMPNSEQRISLENVVSHKQITDYDGVYVNGYMQTYELAAATSLVCEALDVPYANQEFHDAPSLSKLTAYVKMARRGVPFPVTLAGSKYALSKSDTGLHADLYPAVLKRADADRGIDNFKVTSRKHALELLKDYSDDSLWILQKFVPNDGYYVVSCYGGEPKFCIFRTLEERPDRNELKAHMFKPKGGANASLIDIAEAPSTLLKVAMQAISALNRQIGSVDCLYDSSSDRVNVLEVNYNPQMVTIETFKEARVAAFTDYLDRDW